MTSPNHQPPFQLAEYEALRAAIRERGTARMLLVPAAFVGWAALVIAQAAVVTMPALGTLVPLLVLGAAFEGVFALHLNVERLGRYIQAFHENTDEGWEHVAMAYGERFPGGGSDPLFARLFIFGASVNFFSAALAGLPLEVIAIGACHFVFIYRVRRAQGAAKALRAEDLKRFEALRSAQPAAGAQPGPAPDIERPNG
jgi:hypothetical protein